MKLTEKQLAALIDASENNRLFQTPIHLKYAPNVLSRLCEMSLLERTLSGVTWILTEAGREAVAKARGETL